MTVLITGAGLLGSYVAAALQDKEKVILYSAAPHYRAIEQVCGTRPAIIDGDILDMQSLTAIMAEYRPKAIVHTAIVRQKAAAEDPKRAMSVNVQGTKNVLKLAEKGHVRVIYPSSASVYGIKVMADKPIPEQSLLRPGTLYGKTKLQSERLVLQYKDSIALRFPSLFGHWSGDTSTGNALFRNMIGAALEGKEAIIGDPFPPAEHIYIKDAVQAIMLALHAKNLKNNVFNIGTGVLETYDHALKIIKRLIPSARIRLRPVTSAMDFRNQPLDIRLARAELGYAPQYTLAKGVREYVQTIKKWRKKRQ